MPPLGGEMEAGMEFDVNRAIAYFQNVVTQHYSDFNGRVSRKDYWTYIAVYVVIAIITALVQRIVGLGLTYLLHLALLLPNAGLTARRIQDTDKPGTIVWLLMIPVLILNLVTLLLELRFGLFGLILFFGTGFLILLVELVALVGFVYIVYLCVQPGTKGPNNFGPEPAIST